MLRALAAAVAEKGYPETTVADVVERAATSQRTFYEHFANKEEAMIAALDSGSAQMLATILPAFRRAPDWQDAVRIAYEAMFAFAAAEPEYTRLGAVEMYAAGKRALEQRDGHGGAGGAAGARLRAGARDAARSRPRRSGGRSTR